MLVENKLKNIIITNYNSLRKFAIKINMPYSTLDTILKRGVNKANIKNIMLICNELCIDSRELVLGKIIYKTMHNNKYNLFANRLKTLRLTNKLQQKELAKKIGISPVMISQYESGKKEPSRETLYKIAEIFNVTVDYLLCRTNNPYDTDSLELEGTYLRLAKGAQELGLNDDDVDAILSLYKTHKIKEEI